MSYTKYKNIAYVTYCPLRSKHVTGFAKIKTCHIAMHTMANNTWIYRHAYKAISSSEWTPKYSWICDRPQNQAYR